MTTDTTTVDETMQGATILDRTVCLAISKSRFGNRHKAQLERVITAADKAMLSLSKRLLESPELKEVLAVDRDYGDQVKALTTPSNFKTGVHLLSIPLIERAEAILREWKEKRIAAIEAFVGVYPAQIQAAAQALKDQFDATNYPASHEIAATFALSWQYVTFGVPGSLREIRASLFAEEQEKYRVQLVEAADEYRNTLRARLLASLDSLAESLKPQGDGKKKRIYEAHIEKLTETLALFELQDATDDSAAKAIVEQARAVMSGVDVAQLRDDEAFKARVAAGLDAAIGSLRVITTDRGSRGIRLDDGEADE